MFIIQASVYDLPQEKLSDVYSIMDMRLIKVKASHGATISAKAFQRSPAVCNPLFTSLPSTMIVDSAVGVRPP